MTGSDAHASTNQPDPITTEVVGSSLIAAANEMGEVLVRAAFSTNIKERRDTSAAVLDPNGDTIAQAELQRRAHALASPRASSRSTRRSSLPTVDLGRSSRISTCLGTL